MKMINYEEEHRKLWNWLADHPDKDKEDYFEDWPEERIPIQECFACEATRKGSLAADCGRCPLGGHDIVGCFDSDGLLQSWRGAWGSIGERTKLARQIAELPWEEDNDDQGEAIGGFMRLIDADELISYLGFENTQAEREENVGEIVTLEMIDNIPTAYDLDGVLKRLEEEKNPMYRENGTLMGERKNISIDKAIEIVKGGVK